MKVFKRLVLITAIILVTCTGISFAAQTGEVNTSGIRIRKEANTTSDILTVIYKGDKVEILDESGEWFKIKASGNTGYVKKEFIKLNNEASSKPENTSKPNNTTVKKDNTVKQENTVDSTNTVVENKVNDKNQIASLDGKLLTIANTNVRVLPNMTSRIINVFPQDKALMKTGEMNNWIQVTDGVTTGWIPKSKIKGNDQTDVDANPINTSDIENTTVVDNKTNTLANTSTNTNTAKNTSVNNNTSNTNKTNTTIQNKVEDNKKTETSTNKIGVVNVETAKVRASADSKAKVLGFLDLDDKITITAESGDWYKFTASDISGYVNKKLITIKSEGVSSRGNVEDREEYKENVVVEDKKEEKKEESLEASNSSIVDFSKQYLGYPYVVAGKKPSTGFDCSGFTKYVYAEYGYSLGSTSASQQNSGTEVDREEMIPGDLIVFYNEEKTKVGHVGIYIGNGEFVHAANPERGVVIDNINSNSYYNTRFISARRIIK